MNALALLVVFLAASTRIIPSVVRLSLQFILLRNASEMAAPTHTFGADSKAALVSASERTGRTSPTLEGVVPEQQGPKTPRVRIDDLCFRTENTPTGP